MGEYNGRTVCAFFHNPFEFDYYIPYLNLPPIAIENITFPLKRDLCTSGPLPATISVAYKNSDATLTPPCHPRPIHFSASITTVMDHLIIRDWYEYEKLKKANALGAMM